MPTNVQITYDQLRRALVQLLPVGRLWPTIADLDSTSDLVIGLANALATEAGRVCSRAADLRNEATPSTALETLEDWETWMGLDPTGLTTTERRLAILAIQSLANRSRTVADMEAVAAEYGEVNGTLIQGFTGWTTGQAVGLLGNSAGIAGHWPAYHLLYTYGQDEGAYTAANDGGGTNAAATERPFEEAETARTFTQTAGSADWSYDSDITTGWGAEGDTFRASAWVKADISIGSLTISPNFGDTDYVDAGISSVTDWHRIEWTYTATAGFTYPLYSISTAGAASDTVTLYNFRTQRVNAALESAITALKHAHLTLEFRPYGEVHI